MYCEMTSNMWYNYLPTAVLHGDVDIFVIFEETVEFYNIGMFQMSL